MFTTKIIASLFLIATAGLLDAGRGLVGADGAARATTTLSTAEAATTGMMADAIRTSGATGAQDGRPSRSLGDIQREVARALAMQVRKDLDDPALTVDVSGLTLRRDAALMVSVDGDARVSLGGGASLPLRVEADWNAGTQRIERLDYRVTGDAVRNVHAAGAAAMAARQPSASPALGAKMRSAIESRLNDGMAGEFSSQHPRFELVSIEGIASGRYRMVVTGTGITRFPGEGAAFTRFSASVDKFDGHVAQADYDLLQQLDQDEIAAR
jgi:hypothetical protein